MPQSYNPGSGQDWAPVNAGRGGIAVGGGGSRGSSAVPKSARDVDAAKAAGILTTEKKFAAGSNKSAHAVTSTGLSARKLDEADDVGTIAKVDKNLSKAIMAARTAKKLTQKELATAVNEKPTVVAEYESGKAVPNPQIIAKLERKLGVKLPRPGQKSTVNAPKPVGASSAASAGGSGKGTATGGGLTRGGPPKRR